MNVVPFQLISQQLDPCVVVKWSLKDGEVGARYCVPGPARATVQVLGAFGVSGRVDMRGSLLTEPGEDEWFTVRTPTFMTGVSFFAPGGSAVQETVKSFSPIVAQGSGVQVDVYLLVALGKE